MDINAAIDRAIALHQGGDLGGAEALYRQILIEAPALAGIHYLLGMAVLGQGRAADAVKALRTAVRLKPGVAEWSLNLGIALRRTGETTAALATLRAAAPLCAGAPVLQAEVLSETGALLLALGQDAEAELALRAALSLAPGHALARDNLAALLFNRFAGAGALDRSDAPSALAEAVQLAPQRTAAWFRLGQALLRAEQPQSALEAFDKGLGQNPQDQNLILGRSDALSVLGRFEEARDAAIKAAALAPATLGPPVALAVASHGLGMLSAAAAALRGVLAVDPAHVPALLNLGNVLNDLGDDAGAEECYRQVLSHEPGLPVAHWQRAQARLRAGDLEEGWREYEWRWRMPGFVVPSAVRALPVWDGGAAPEGRLLIHAEQGHGDSLQFIRYVPLLRDRGMDIHVQVQPALVRLFRESLPDDIGVGALGDPIPAGTVLRCPLLGLPLRLGTR
uniref:tetratricopeptide repeat protein n=1 Tax=Niveispirillum sp. TaxID=1917217 RepID=UPI001B5BFA17